MPTRTKEQDKQISALEGIKNYFTARKEMLEAKIDKASEKWLESDNGTEAQTELDSLDNIVTELESAFDNLGNLYEQE